MKKIGIVSLTILSTFMLAAETYLEDGYSQTVYQGTWCDGALNVYFRKSIDSTGVLIGGTYPSTGNAVWRSNETNITLNSSVTYSYNEHVAVGYSIPHTYSYKVGRISPGAFFSFDFVKPTTVTIPAAIDSYSIPTTTFNTCKNLVSLRINKDMQLTHTFFDGISDLREICVGDSNSYNASYDGMLFNKERTTLLRCPEGRTKDVILPNGLMAIGESAFENSLITSVEIPDSVNSIGVGAFGDCDKLSTVKLPSGIKDISAWTFQNTAIEDLIIPNAVTGVWFFAFRHCDKLKRLVMPESLRVLDVAAIDDATNVNVIFRGSVPKTLTQFGCVEFHKNTKGTYSRKHATEWESVISDGKWMNMSMSEFSATVTYSLGEHGSRIGGGQLVQTLHDFGESATPPVVQTEPGWGFTGWDISTENVQSNLLATALYEELTCCEPVITPVDGSVFTTDSQEISITCSTDGATIYYTTNATTPKTTANYLYTGPFVITGTSTIKAVAAKEGWTKSAYTTATISKVSLTLESVLGGDSRIAITTGGAANWLPVSDTNSKDGGSCARSGLSHTDDNSESWIQLAVNGKGTLVFGCKTSCEHDDDDTYSWDHVEVTVDGVPEANWRMDGETQWIQRSVTFDTAGEHAVKILYVKDSSAYEGDDCAWIDNVVWTPSATPVDPIPDIGETPSAADVEAAVAGAADPQVKAKIDATNYNDFRDWAGKVKTKGGDGAGAQGVMNADTAWFSYALGQDTLLATAPTDSDLTVKAFTPTGEAGKFDFTMSVGTIQVGSAATKENLKKIFGIEGAATLDSAAFSSDKVDIEFGTPVDGKVKFTAGPNSENANNKAFFMKVKMLP